MLCASSIRDWPPSLRSQRRAPIRSMPVANGDEWGVFGPSGWLDQWGYLLYFSAFIIVAYIINGQFSHSYKS